ncbi:MAG: aminotransferase class I/II-fold pyridoxal phosphate-dependent enzyme, partial [Clostridia bacterium]|nr:aminotransferase class I/II-fold pyridoxal phosphate-dependent enzyme [Clostridia bacterium]
LSGPEKKRTALRDGLGRLFAMRLCPNTASQIAIEAAMKDTAFTEKMIRELILPRRDMALSVLDTIPGISYVKNSAAFYLFPKLDSRFHITDDRRFAMDLLEAKNILIVPGSGFSYPAPDRFRLVLLPDPSVLKNAMEDLGDFLSDYRQDQR